MKIFKYKIQFFALLFLTIGCNDEEFLLEEPKTFYTFENIFSSESQVDQLLITMYSRVRNFRTTNYQAKGFSTDVMDAPEFRLSTTFGDYSRINPERGEFRNTYTFYYQLIATANTAIYAANLDEITFESDEKRAYTIAQARFFRAYAHGMLAELFGGVPIVTEIATEPKYDYQRATREATYQFAIDELEAILVDLPEITVQDGRIVKGAAQHYLAEFYLGLGITSTDASAYDQAIKHASNVIDGGTYALMTERFGERMNEPGKDVYWDLFRINNINYNDGNMESIWTFQVDFDAYLTEDRQSVLNYPRYYMPVYRAILGFDGVAEDAGGRGDAFYKQTPYAGDLIWEDPISANDQRGAEHNIIRTIIYNDPNFPELFGTVVPQDVIDETNAGRGWVYPIIFKLTTDQFVGLDQGENRSNLFRDDYAIRLAETILLRAEAYHRKGDNQSAANDINSIRSRAQCDVLISAGEVNIDFILDERARELFGEECRWNTLLRMGGTVAVDRIRKYAMHEITPLTLNFDYNLWPIPQSVIDRNKDVVMEQNPGWINR
ncbi:MAG: RagB/SusD family nutrient uptake outer membrane protein [Cytophagales bacterium]|nr:RagB/SusD family nutrient uptake outer membrane protein [Cytophagales bacterium]